MPSVENEKAFEGTFDKENEIKFDQVYVDKNNYTLKGDEHFEEVLIHEEPTTSEETKEVVETIVSSEIPFDGSEVFDDVNTKRFLVSECLSTHEHYEFEIAKQSRYSIKSSDPKVELALFLKRDLGHLVTNGTGEITTNLKQDSYFLVISQHSEDFSVKVVDLGQVS
jgi:hypothetical protein